MNKLPTPPVQVTTDDLREHGGHNNDLQRLEAVLRNEHGLSEELTLAEMRSGRNHRTTFVFEGKTAVHVSGYFYPGQKVRFELFDHQLPQTQN